ncbi:MAG: hypothetical protein IKQ31_02640 [Clostridia bacterium]|nr:hypothetical protein [Clostridia bacterium]
MIELKEVNTEKEINIDIASVLGEPKEEKVEIDDDIEIILIKLPNKILGQKSSEIKLCGKSMADWVKLAFNTTPTEVELTEKTTVLQIAKAYAKKTYTAVFFSDTPLLSKKVFAACLNYVKNRGLNVACFDRGYIFITSALQTLKVLPSIPLSSFAKLQEFFVVDDVNKLMLAEKFLRKRIIDYHIKNGVHFLDESTCIIECDVVLGQNVEIWGGNVLRGKTKIGNDTILFPNNYIEDSSIGSKCKILNSIVRASKIKDNSELPPQTCVEKGIINKR